MWRPFLRPEENKANVFEKASAVGLSNGYGDNKDMESMTEEEKTFYFDLIKTASTIIGMDRFNTTKKLVHVSNDYFVGDFDSRINEGDRFSVFGNGKSEIAVSFHNITELDLYTDVETPLFTAKGISCPANDYACVVFRKKGQKAYLVHYSGKKESSIEFIVKIKQAKARFFVQEGDIQIF